MAQVIDKNEPPTMEPLVVGVPEDYVAGASVLDRLPAEDQDAGQENMLTFEKLSCNSTILCPLFDLRSNGALYLDSNWALPIPKQNEPGVAITIKVTDPGGPRNEQSLSAQFTFVVDFTDRNFPPEINDQTVFIDEREMDAIVVPDLGATDQDEVDTLTYFIDSVTPEEYYSYFVIGTDGKSLQLNVGREFDFETQSTFEVVVFVQDDGPGRLSASCTITVNVNDIQEYPEFGDIRIVIDENPTPGMALATIDSSDVDM